MIIISKENKTNEDNAIRINSIQANTLYYVNNGVENAKLERGKAVINDSIFSKYMRSHGVTIKKKGRNLDFVTMKYEYGTKAKKVGKKQLEKMTSSALRKYYYENGASVDWTYTDEEGNVTKIIPKSYKMLMRSPGKAKEGECIFIRDDLHEKALDYITMGLYKKMPYDNAKIVELSAYSTLITATAIDYIKLPLDNMFVVKDAESSVWKKAYTVKAKDVEHIKYEIDFGSLEMEEYINSYGLTFYKKKVKQNPRLSYIKRTITALEENGVDIEKCPTKPVTYTRKECYVDRDKELSEITNILWDGMGICEDSLFPEDMEGFIYCRSHFFKSCLFRGNIQEYFKDKYGDRYEGAVETDMLGRKMKVSDIKVIVTENSLKWMKFIDLMGGRLQKAYKYYEQFMKKHGEEFAIVKTAHASKWGDMQRSSYQMNGSLPTVDEEILGNIAKPSINYCNALKLDEKAYLKHLEINSGNYSVNEVLLALNEWNEDFKYTSYFKEKKDDTISKFKKERLQLGKLFQYGDNLTICGNPIALLMKVMCGQDKDSKKEHLEEGCFEQKDDCIQCYTTRFDEGEYIAGFRSPHNSPNNIVYLENVYPKEIQTYFPKLGNNVIVINGIGTDVQSRLNGQDLDTDSIYATNQPDIVALAKKAYNEYPTIINGIEQLGTSEYKKSMESYAKMDNDISAAQYAIGYSSNLAQLALSYYYHDGSNNKDLEDVFIICSVLAQVAIDSAKRNFEIKVSPELNRISKLDCMKREPKYPRFYVKVQELKNRKKPKSRQLEIKDDDIGDFNCPMDILYRIIDEGVINLTKHKELNTRTVNRNVVFEFNLEKQKGRDREQHIEIISMVEECDKAVKELDRDDEDYAEKRRREFESCLRKIKRKTIKEATMYALIAYAFKHEGKSICDRMLTVLYNYCKEKNHPENFLNCFKKTEKVLQNIGQMPQNQGFSISAYEEGCERNVS